MALDINETNSAPTFGVALFVAQNAIKEIAKSLNTEDQSVSDFDIDSHDFNSYLEDVTTEILLEKIGA